MSDEDQVMRLCQRWGASEAQARVMAKQLLKRADQLAAERGWTRVEAMAHLLTLVAKGSQGETTPEFPGGRPPSAAGP